MTWGRAVGALVPPALGEQPQGRGGRRGGAGEELRAWFMPYPPPPRPPGGRLPPGAGNKLPGRRTAEADFQERGKKNFSFRIPPRHRPLVQSSIISVIYFFLNRSPRIILSFKLHNLFSTVGMQGLNSRGGGEAVLHVRLLFLL